MLDLSTKVDLVCVDCVNVERAIESMKKSMKHVLFNECILFTSLSVECKHNGIKIVNIPKISNLQELSIFLLDYLILYLQDNEGHIIICQHDSWIVNPDTWTDEFLKYDYIGAPFVCHLPLVQGNGGFSLRSKKMAKFIKFSKEFIDKTQDDSSICHINRELLEKNGFKFAPIELAKQFSVEGRPITTQFGHHASEKIIEGYDVYEIKPGEKSKRKVFFNPNPTDSGNIKVFPVPSEKQKNAYAYQIPAKELDAYIIYEKDNEYL